MEFEKTIDWAAGTWGPPRTKVIGPTGVLVETIAPPWRDQVCRLCGAGRRRGETDDQWLADVGYQLARHEVTHGRDEGGREVYTAPERPWSRRHASCIPTASAVLEAVLGVELTEDQAREVLAEHGSLLAGSRDASPRRPWGHVGDDERRRLGEEVRRVIRAAAPRPCVDGRCGVCGVGRSIRWDKVPGLRWSASGRPVAACGHCADLLPDLDGTVDVDELRVRAIGVLAGVWPGYSLRAHGSFGMRLAAEVLRDDEEHDADAVAWAFRPEQLAEVRRAVRELRPELIVDDVQRAIGMKLLDARRARAAAEAERAHAERTPGPGTAW